MSDTTTPQLTATFCFVDLAGFTALTEAHGDERAADLAASFSDLVHRSAGEGRIAKLMGDAALVVCPSPRAALEMLERLFAAVARAGEFPELRAGLAHGRAVERAGDVFGAVVNLAARITSHARGGQVVASHDVAQVAREMGMSMESIGIVKLRNVRDPVELFQIDVTARGDLGAVEIDSVCRMRVVPEGAAGRLRIGERDYWFCSVECVKQFTKSPESYIG